jgi:cellobiose epimerase
MLTPPPSPGCDTASCTPLAAVDLRRIEMLRRRIEMLLEDALRFWLRHGHDDEYGGFHGTLNRFGEPIEPSHKGLIQQARHLWTFSACGRSLAAMSADRGAAIRGLAHSAFRFIVQHYLDPEDGEFFQLVDRQGTPLDRRKDLYSNGFAIYGLAEYALAFDSAQARELALACFESLDKTTHDSTYGGYDQTHRPSVLGTHAAKDTNTHLHLMEALVNLYRATSNQKVGQRAAELVRLILTKHIQPSGQTHARFTRDFTPLGNPTISYGHDIEIAWLSFDAIDTLVLDDRSSLRGKAYQLGRNAADWGYDPIKGGFFEEGIPMGAATGLEKVWWVQIEAIAGLYMLYQYRADRRLLDQLEGTLDFSERYLLDPNEGEWYWGVLPGGSLGPRRDNKGEEWKASYHLVRGLMFTAAWMSQTLSLASTTRAECISGAQGVDTHHR